jgi:Zn-dependent oligopeptidase
MAKNDGMYPRQHRKNLKIAKIGEFETGEAQLLGYKTYADYVLKHRMAAMWTMSTIC